MTTQKNAIAFLLFLSILAAPIPALARPIKMWSYQELLEQADLVVIATAVASADQSKVEPREDAAPDAHVTVVTTFKPLSILKGKAPGEKFVLEHERYLKKESEVTIKDGAFYITFDTTGKTTYLLFLKREDDGNYSPLSGQYDPHTSVKIVQNYSWPARLDVRWGEAVNGLQAGIRRTSGERAYRAGEMVTYEVLLRNVSKKEIVIQEMRGGGWMPMVKDRVIDILGMYEISGDVAVVTTRIAPGETVTYTGGPHRFVVRLPGANPREEHEVSLELAPGKYEVTATVSLSAQIDNNLPAPWTGQLSAGKGSLEIVAGAPEKTEAVQDGLK